MANVLLPEADADRRAVRDDWLIPASRLTIRGEFTPKPII